MAVLASFCTGKRRERGREREKRERGRERERERERAREREIYISAKPVKFQLTYVTMHSTSTNTRVPFIHSNYYPIIETYLHSSTHHHPPVTLRHQHLLSHDQNTCIPIRTKAPIAFNHKILATRGISYSQLRHFKNLKTFDCPPRHNAGHTQGIKLSNCTLD